MFNLGLESMQDNHISSEIDMYSFIENLREIQSGLSTLNNLFVIKQSIETYGNTPQLKDLVGKSFEDSGVNLSIEGLGDAITSAINWILEKIRAIWDTITGLFKKKVTIGHTQYKDIQEYKKIAQEQNLGNNNISITIVDMSLIDNLLNSLTLGQIGNSISNIMSKYHTKYDNEYESFLNESIDKYKTFITMLNSVSVDSSRTMTINESINYYEKLFSQFKKTKLPSKVQIEAALKGVQYDVTTFSKQNTGIENAQNILRISKIRLQALEYMTTIERLICDIVLYKQLKIVKIAVVNEIDSKKT